MPSSILNWLQPVYETSRVASSGPVWTALFNTEAPDILVLEFGVRHGGDMQQLIRTVIPDIAILTTLTPSYSTDVEELHTLQG